ncbi:MAG: ABC transporter [Chitinophagaceae bacterium BSSC1]|nr:MAG: ABC transporter [Chitinophagaceae bacterium BSSC1]
MLQFRKVEKYYGAHLALTVPDLDLQKGMYWIQGENGSGKTTFLKMLAGLHPFKGEIFLGEKREMGLSDNRLRRSGVKRSELLSGSDSRLQDSGVLRKPGSEESGSEKSLSILKDRNDFLKKVNYAEAEPLYPPFLTAKDLVELYGATKKADIDAAKQQLEELHILDAYEQTVGTYSSGMVKKLSLVLAFMGNPDWILLDEPLITIDVAAVELVCKWINDWHARKGISFLISSHQSFADGLKFTGKLSVVEKKLQVAS